MTSWPQFWSVEAKIADLGFSEIWYFFLYFFLQNFNLCQSYGDLIFYACELRCAGFFSSKIWNLKIGFCELINHASNSVLDRNSAHTDVTDLVLLKLIEKRSSLRSVPSYAYGKTTLRYVFTTDNPGKYKINGQYFVQSSWELGSLVFRTWTSHQLM